MLWVRHRHLPLDNRLSWMKTWGSFVRLISGAQEGPAGFNMTDSGVNYLQAYAKAEHYMQHISVAWSEW